MNRVLWAVALTVVLGLSISLPGCRKESSKPSPAPAASKLAQPDGDTARIAELENQLRAADSQIAQIKTERDAALAKAKEAQVSANYNQSQLQDERKTRDETTAKLRNVEATLNALRERLSAGGEADWVVRVEAEAFQPQQDVQVKQDPKASGGKALLFDKKTSFAETVVTVKPGTYRVVPVGMAPGGGDHDAMSLTIKPVDGTEGAAGPEKAAPIDIQQRVCFDEKFDQFVDGSSSPAIVIAREGKLKITLRATEETGFLVDRVEIRVYLPK